MEFKIIEAKKRTSFEMKLIQLKRDIEIILEKNIKCSCIKGRPCMRCDILNRLKELQERKIEKEDEKNG